VVEMEVLLHQVRTVGVIVKTSSVDIWSLSRLYELACVRLESPYQVVQSNTRGVLYSLCWRENGSNFQLRAYATMKWNCLEVMNVSWKGRMKPHPTMLWVYVNAHLNTRALVFNLMPIFGCKDIVLLSCHRDLR
jgi:hypothetical protein